MSQNRLKVYFIRVMYPIKEWNWCRNPFRKVYMLIKIKLWVFAISLMSAPSEWDSWKIDKKPCEIFMHFSKQTNKKFKHFHLYFIQIVPTDLRLLAVIVNKMEHICIKRLHCITHPWLLLISILNNYFVTVFQIAVFLWIDGLIFFQIYKGVHWKLRHLLCHLNILVKKKVFY